MKTFSSPLPLDTSEPFPLGKQLFFASCAVRGKPKFNAEYDWVNWEEVFMTKAMWEHTAKLFLITHGIHF